MASAIVKRVGLSAGLWAAGDATCQIIVPNVLGVPAAPYDSMQTARQALFGGLFMASAGHGFYGGIEKLLPGNALKNVCWQGCSRPVHLRTCVALRPVLFHGPPRGATSPRRRRPRFIYALACVADELDGLASDHCIESDRRARSSAGDGGQPGLHSLDGILGI